MNNERELARGVVYSMLNADPFSHPKHFARRSMHPLVITGIIAGVCFAVGVALL